MPTTDPTISKTSKATAAADGGRATTPRTASGTSPHELPSSSTAPAAAVATVAVVGASGYTGALLAELLLRHPAVVVSHLTSESFAGRAAARHLPRLRTDLTFCTEAEVEQVDVAFVCTPHGQAAPVVKRLLEAGVRVVDLSADFRLDAATYAEWYGEHPFPEMLPAVYGLTELHRDAVAGAELVANPGCYPTAALLALEPLKQFGLLDVVIDAKSGVSGAGKTPKEATHFCSVDSDLVAYGVGSHRHYPEIAAGLAGAAAACEDGIAAVFGAGGRTSAQGAGTSPASPSLIFVPHLAPLQRGIAETIYVRLGTRSRLSTAHLREAFIDRYAGESFVAVSDGPPQLKDVAGTNCCRLYVQADERSGRVVVLSAIDNLMKGASGQAVQNMNVMLGLPETQGLL